MNTLAKTVASFTALVLLLVGCDPGPREVVESPPAPAVNPVREIPNEERDRVEAACRKDVEGGRLAAHRHGNTGFSPDRVLHYGWGDFTVRAQADGIPGFHATSYVDTLNGYGNVIRTPFDCLVGGTFEVRSVTFGKIQFPGTQ